MSHQPQVTVVSFSLTVPAEIAREAAPVAMDRGSMTVPCWMSSAGESSTSTSHVYFPTLRKKSVKLQDDSDGREHEKANTVVLGASSARAGNLSRTRRTCRLPARPSTVSLAATFRAAKALCSSESHNLVAAVLLNLPRSHRVNALFAETDLIPALSGKGT